MEQERAAGILSDCFLIFPLLRQKLTLAMVPGDVKIMRRIQFIVLHQISKNKYIAMGKLAESLHISKQHLVNIVNLLQERGLVERMPSPVDGRVVLLSLSADGKKYLDRTKKHTTALLASKAQALPEDYLDRLAAVAGELVGLLEMLPEETVE